jgi:membrane protein implicated in regulation of membrane protease activity
MFGARIFAGMIYRIFLLSLIVAVLWVKGYLWWVFGIAIVLFTINMVVNLPLGRRIADDEDSDEDDEDSDEDDEDSDVENNGVDKPPF